MKLKLWFPLILFLFMAVALWWGLYKDPHKISSPLINKPIPGFHAENLTESEAQLTEANFLNQVTVLNVFATWCVACRDENKLLMKIASENSIEIYGLDYRDTREAALSWLGNYGNPYKQIIYDPQGKLAIDFGVYGTPETFIIDKKGIIRYKHLGVLSQEAWLNTLLPLVRRLEQE